MRIINIDIQTYRAGDDKVFVITGGKAHIGGISTAFWHDNKLCITTEELPDHKEGELSAEMAKLAAIKCGHTCTVIMGIHLDDATKQEIEHIVIEVRRKMNLLLKNGATM